MFYWLIVLFHLVILPVAALHALICKRDHRAALGWIGVIFVFPVAGPLMYFIFGINRLQAKAQVFTGRHLPVLHLGYQRAIRRPPSESDPLAEQLPKPYLATVGGRATGSPLLSGNAIKPLINGEAFFPQLIEQIERAQHYVLLSSYLFSAKGVADDIIQALGRASQRGVGTYVLVDGVGTWYSFRQAVRALKRVGVRVALFNPPSLVPPSLDINMRNHRKIAVVDNQVGFFGGINIDARHMVEAADNPTPTEDMHFLAQGPVVAELRRLFEYDWQLVTEEVLNLKDWPESSAGSTICRVIDDGPHDNLNHLSMTLSGAFTAARTSISIMMPYFLPSYEIISALQTASLRGVRVQILLPETSNLRFVDWASRNMLWELLLWDVEIYVKPVPFAHTKLITIDEHYVMAGSANLDARSLRLNFELGVEIYDTPLAFEMNDHIASEIAISRQLSLNELDSRPFWQRLRDAFFWLFSSYL